ncbi:ABC transporter permease [Acidovorax sp. GBBC 3334]|uniref:ABC transporter permease n=1 Tax=Acidovorax sp. GBBC 3334 TaxID=2940496 RepID=UPI002302DFE0|nr:ABC transporter permease [Acidovorax sp. GBBC 3334]MDA8453612.1 ABC transporter permease [Acidovorax sp. GBBC 3334]
MTGRTTTTAASTARGWAGILLRRGLQIVALALIVGTLCFAMARSLPGDMATRIAAGRYGYDLVSNAAASAVRGELGLDRPVWQALLSWWGDIARLDLGTSFVSGDPVWNEIAHQLGATVDLSVAALLIAMALGLPLGIWSGLHPGGRVDRTAAALAVLLRATPPFLLAVLLMLAVAVHLGMLPVAGDAHAGSLLLPALTLGLGLAAGLARVAGAAMRQAAASPSLVFARAKGLTDRQALWRHGLPQAALPVVAYLGVQSVFLVEGAVVVETLFAWPGIGHALVHAVFGRDVPMVQGAALCMGLLFVMFNLLVDAACVAIDPRRRTDASA